MRPQISVVQAHLIHFPGGSGGKASAYNVGDLGSIPGSRRSSGEGNGNPLQYSCLENPMDGRAWQAKSPWGCKESDTTEQLHLKPICGILLQQPWQMNTNTVFCNS